MEPQQPSLALERQYSSDDDASAEFSRLDQSVGDLASRMAQLAESGIFADAELLGDDDLASSASSGSPRADPESAGSSQVQEEAPAPAPEAAQSGDVADSPTAAEWVSCDAASDGSGSASSVVWSDGLGCFVAPALAEAATEMAGSALAEPAPPAPPVKVPSAAPAPAPAAGDPPVKPGKSVPMAQPVAAPAAEPGPALMARVFKLPLPARMVSVEIGHSWGDWLLRVCAALELPSSQRHALRFLSEAGEVTSVEDLAEGALVLAEPMEEPGAGDESPADEQQPHEAAEVQAPRGLPGWHDGLARADAYAKLQGRSEGTYLFRRSSREGHLALDVVVDGLVRSFLITPVVLGGRLRGLTLSTTGKMVHADVGSVVAANGEWLREPLAPAFRCPACTLENAPEAAACAACGAANPAPAPARPGWRCACSLTNLDAAPACVACGRERDGVRLAQLISESTEPEPVVGMPVAVAVPVAVEETVDDRWACERCTLRNAADDAVCGACGASRGGPSAVAAAPEEPAVPDATWTCDACSFSSAEASRACEVCGSRRPGATATETLQAAIAAAASGGDAPRPAAPRAADPVWACSVCTLSNPVAAGLCGACGTRRPAPAPEAQACANCGRSVAAGHVSCAHCGTMALWVCGCGARNSGTAGECVACLQPRPGSFLCRFCERRSAGDSCTTCSRARDLCRSDAAPVNPFAPATATAPAAPALAAPEGDEWTCKNCCHVNHAVGRCAVCTAWRPDAPIASTHGDWVCACCTVRNPNAVATCSVCLAGRRPAESAPRAPPVQGRAYGKRARRSGRRR